jgi:hypothetical protein
MEIKLLLIWRKKNFYKVSDPTYVVAYVYIREVVRLLQRYFMIEVNTNTIRRHIKGVTRKSVSNLIWLPVDMMKGHLSFLHLKAIDAGNYRGT